MKQQQKKIRDELIEELDKIKKGINELTDSMSEHNKSVSKLSLKRNELQKKAQSIIDTLDDDYIEFVITDHALVQYLRRIKPDEFKRICNLIKNDKTITKRSIKNVVTTIYPKRTKK